MEKLKSTLEISNEIDIIYTFNRFISMHYLFIDIKNCI